MIDESHVLPLRPRPNPETQPINDLALGPELSEPPRLVIDGWTIQVIGDAVIITCAGEVMTQTRTGQLNQKEIVIRRDPPATSNARRRSSWSTDVRTVRNKVISNMQGQGIGVSFLATRGDNFHIAEDAAESGSRKGPRKIEKPASAAIGVYVGLCVTVAHL